MALFCHYDYMFIVTYIADVAEAQPMLILAFVNYLLLYNL